MSRFDKIASDDKADIPTKITRLQALMVMVNALQLGLDGKNTQLDTRLLLVAIAEQADTYKGEVAEMAKTAAPED